MDAIGHVRRIGSIGAHMEKDINLILDVEPDEAQALIDLIELLFEEWYVASHVREERLKNWGSCGKQKCKKRTGEASPDTREAACSGARS